MFILYLKLKYTTKIVTAGIVSCDANPSISTTVKHWITIYSKAFLARFYFAFVGRYSRSRILMPKVSILRKCCALSIVAITCRSEKKIRKCGEYNAFPGLVYWGSGNNKKNSTRKKHETKVTKSLFSSIEDQWNVNIISAFKFYF